MAQEPQVTPEQIQLWEADPVTIAYLKCLEFYRNDVCEDASSGSIVDSSSADLTHAMIHQNLGQQQGLTTAAGYQWLLNEFAMVLEVEDGE